jgi:hypothetical protein
MDGDSGALNKIEHGEFSAALHDIIVSAENLLGRAETDAQKLFAAGLKVLAADAQTDLGQIATTAIGTALAGAAAGQTVQQIGSSVLPTLETTVVNDAEAAGKDVLNVVLNTTRVMFLGQQAQAGNVTSDASSATQTDSSATGL